MKCPEARGVLAISLDESPSAKDRAGLDEHLDGCPPCLEWLTQQVVIREVLRGLAKFEEAEKPPAVPEHLVRRILAAHKDALAQHRTGRKTG